MRPVPAMADCARDTAPAEELRLDVGGRDLAARRHGHRGGTRVLALHGWLDNAMSFEPLARHLPEWDLVALDLPGHGHSAHRPPRTWYHYIDYLDDAIAALDALGWERCTLLGHSLGGAVASVLAAARPSRVERLLLIEALGPLGFKPGSAVTALRAGFDERAEAPDKQLRRFPDLASAVMARMRANGLSEPVARLLVERSLRAVPGGFEWRSDPRLKIATPLRVHEDMIREWLAAIECPTLLIAADPAPPYFDVDTRRARIACVPGLREVVLPGNHHLHMENPVPVAAAVREFLSMAASS
jgi:pimeloyl-ACP methyl ester carboxylesterase